MGLLYVAQQLYFYNPFPLAFVHFSNLILSRMHASLKHLVHDPSYESTVPSYLMATSLPQEVVLDTSMVSAISQDAMQPSLKMSCMPQLESKTHSCPSLSSCSTSQKKSSLIYPITTRHARASFSFLPTTFH